MASVRGTLLNTATVAAGSAIGLAAGKLMPQSYEALVISCGGLITLGLGVKMFLGHKNLLIVATSVMLGACLGLALGVEVGINHLAEVIRARLGGGGSFVEGFVTTSVLFCVGPMTLLGCIQDGLEGKSELLQIKALLDGIVSIFFAAALGVGVLFSAVAVLIVQGLLTLAAQPLKPLAQDEELMAETVGTGGVLLLGLSLSLLDVKKLGVSNLLPALVLAPLIVLLQRKLTARKG